MQPATRNLEDRDKVYQDSDAVALNKSVKHDFMLPIVTFCYPGEMI